LGIALAIVALAFCLIPMARAFVATRGDRSDLAERARAIRRVDWLLTLALLAIALLAIIVSVVGNGSTFSEPSGNFAGAVVLMAIILFVVVFAALAIRQSVISRARRRLAE
jgi:FtsH-binding integral membrane protein